MAKYMDARGGFTGRTADQLRRRRSGSTRRARVIWIEPGSAGAG